MIILICAILGAAIGFIACIAEYGFDIDAFFAGFLTGLIGLLCGTFIWCCVPTFDSVPQANRETVITEDYELIALKDNFGYQGQRYVFSSYIDEDLYYVYMYHGNRGITSGKAQANKAYIKYLTNDAETPYIEKISESHKNDLWDALWLWGETYYIIHLPQGSVVENVFEINLEE